MDPFFGAAYSLRGTAYANQNKFGRAIADANRAVEISKSSEGFLICSLLERAYVEIKMKRYAAAIEDCDLVLKMKPNESRATDYKETALEESGALKQALDLCTGVIEAGGSLWLEKRAGIYSKLGQNAAAISDLEKLVQINESAGLDELYYAHMKQRITELKARLKNE